MIYTTTFIFSSFVDTENRSTKFGHCICQSNFAWTSFYKTAAWCTNVN